MSYAAFREADKAGLNVSQALALILLTETRMAMTALAESLGRNTATVTGIVDKLEAGELVQRLPHPTDRRSFEVELTEAGRRLGRRIVMA